MCWSDWADAQADLRLYCSHGRKTGFLMTWLEWAEARQNRQHHMCDQRRLGSAWVSVQYDQSLRCPHEESLGPCLPIKRTAKTDPGWSESLLGAHVILLVLSCFSLTIFWIYIRKLEKSSLNESQVRLQPTGVWTNAKMWARIAQGMFGVDSRYRHVAR